MVYLVKIFEKWNPFQTFSEFWWSNSNPGCISLSRLTCCSLSCYYVERQSANEHCLDCWRVQTVTVVHIQYCMYCTLLYAHSTFSTFLSSFLFSASLYLCIFELNSFLFLACLQNTTAGNIHFVYLDYHTLYWTACPSLISITDDSYALVIRLQVRTWVWAWMWYVFVMWVRHNVILPIAH